MWTDGQWREVEADRRESLGVARRPLWLAKLGADSGSDSGSVSDSDSSSVSGADSVSDSVSGWDSVSGSVSGSDSSSVSGADSVSDSVSGWDSDSGSGSDSGSDSQRKVEMRNGLYAVSLSQNNGWSVLRLGWFRRDPMDPDEYETSWCTIYRPDRSARLAPIWLAGPKKAPRNWEFSEPVPSMAHRFHFQPLARLDDELWKSVCPKPKGWE